jgi:hypothetical protein
MYCVLYSSSLSPMFVIFPTLSPSICNYKKPMNKLPDVIFSRNILFNPLCKTTILNLSTLGYISIIPNSSNCIYSSFFFISLSISYFPSK